MNSFFLPALATPQLIQATKLLGTLFVREPPPPGPRYNEQQLQHTYLDTYGDLHK